MVCGLSASPSKILSVPVLLPRPVGVKFTVIVQFCPAATLLPQVLLASAKFALVSCE
jgi:hypothetical protein